MVSKLLAMKKILWLALIVTATVTEKTTRDFRKGQLEGEWKGLETVHLQKNNITRREADFHNSNSYGAPASDVVSINPHDEKFCVDVSTYKPVVWIERDGEECMTEFIQQCDQKSENICAEITETVCEVHKYLFGQDNIKSL